MNRCWRLAQALLRCIFLVVVLGASPAANAGVVGHWKFNEASWNGTAGEVIDSSGLGHHGTALRSATTTSESIFGRAADFRGNVGSVEISAHDDFVLGDNGSVLCWVKFDSLPANTHQIVGGSPYGSTFLLNQYGDSLFVYWRTPGPAFSLPGYLTTDRWYHLALTNNAGALTLYVDGQPVKTGTQGTTAYTNSPIYVGAVSNGGWAIDGIVDDLWIFDRALTQMEILGIIPEPSSFVLLALGLLTVSAEAAWRRRRPGDGSE